MFAASLAATALLPTATAPFQKRAVKVHAYGPEMAASFTKGGDRQWSQ